MLALGIDLGTSGVRVAVVGAGGREVAVVRGDYRAPQAPETDAADWWDAVDRALLEIASHLGADMARIRAVAVAGTSGSMVLVDRTLKPVTPALMYHSSGFDAEAEAIAREAPRESIARGSNSAVARLLRLQSLDSADCAAHLCHQADLVSAHLRGGAGLSDDTNTLKLGWDPETQRWPGWFAAAGVRTRLLPRVVRVGAPYGTLAPPVARAYVSLR